MGDVDERPRARDGRDGVHIHEDLRDDDDGGRVSDLRGGVSDDAEATGGAGVVVQRVLVGVRDRERAAKEDEQHRKHAEHSLPAGRGARVDPLGDHVSTV